MSCSISNKVQTCYYTVKGESSVAKFLVNSFKWEPFEEACGCARSAGCTRRYSRGHPFSRHSSYPLLLSLPHQSPLFMSATIMAPHLNVVQHLLIKTLLVALEPHAVFA